LHAVIPGLEVSVALCPVDWSAVFDIPALKKLVVYKSGWKAIPQGILQHAALEEL